MMLATRVGAGIAAEIGSMKVTEQLDALRMSGVLPIDYLLVPRFLACIVMTVALSLIGGAIMYGAGGLTAYLSFGVNPRTFFDPAMVEPRHLVLGLLKAASYGAAIPIVAGSAACARGLERGRRLGDHRRGGRQLVRGDRARLRAVGRRAVAAGRPAVTAARGRRPARARARYIEFVGVHQGVRRQAGLARHGPRVARGEILYIIGTSGVGKSVTIKHLIGFLAVDAARSGSTASASISSTSAASTRCAAGSAWCSRARPCSTP
jgi:hypothetical protein